MTPAFLPISSTVISTIRLRSASDIEKNSLCAGHENAVYAEFVNPMAQIPSKGPLVDRKVVVKRYERSAGFYTRRRDAMGSVGWPNGQKRVRGYRMGPQDSAPNRLHRPEISLVALSVCF